jgi:heme exporter protein B
VFAKDWRLELRSRFALNTILMFGVTTLTLVSFSLGQIGLPAKLQAALLWIILFFSSTAALAQVFVREEETGTGLALRLKAEPTAVYLGKFGFNLLLLMLLTVIIAPLYFVFTDASPSRVAPLAIVLFLGVLCLCSASTLVAAIIARAAMRGALFAVLSFPILILPLIMLVEATAKLLTGGPTGGIGAPVQGLVAYIVVMVTASLMLFKFVWRE